MPLDAPVTSATNPLLLMPTTLFDLPSILDAAVGLDRHTGAGVTPTPELLDKLLRAPAPSGYEAPAAAIWREAASFASLSSDGIGSSVARVGEASPLLTVVGHIDEIGL